MIAQQAADALRRHVLEPLTEHVLDEEYGGFLVDLDERWRPAGPQEKSLEHQARTTIVFALLEQVMPGEGCERMARHGFEFLTQCMWDAEHGGFFARVDRSGQPLWKGLKHPHAVVYATQALYQCRTFLPPGLSEQWAQRAFGWLEDVAWDEAHGGYWGCYRADNTSYSEDERLPTPDGRDALGFTAGFKEINTQSDALEMLPLLASDGVGTSSARRLEWLTRLVTHHLMDDHGALPYAYRRDWRPAPCLIRVGYQLTTARRLAILVGEGAHAPELSRTCQRLVDFCLARARHPDGGFCFAVTADGRSWPDTGPDSDLRQWWVQFEAVHALHALARDELLPDEQRAHYRRELDEQWAFVNENYFDERHGGVLEEPSSGSRRSTARSGVAPTLKSHPWKDASHETSTLVALVLAGR